MMVLNEMLGSCSAAAGTHTHTHTHTHTRTVSDEGTRQEREHASDTGRYPIFFVRAVLRARKNGNVRG